MLDRKNDKSCRSTYLYIYIHTHVRLSAHTKMPVRNLSEPRLFLGLQEHGRLLLKLNIEENNHFSLEIIMSTN